MRAHRWLFVAVLACATAPAASAQKKKVVKAPDVVCRARDTTAVWYKAQRTRLADGDAKWSNDSLRAALIAATGVDASKSLTIQFGWQIVDSLPPAPPEGAAAESIAKLRTLATTRGSTWPTRSVVGAAGVRAVWLLAMRDSTIEAAVLKRMMESGPDEALAPDVAVLEDRVRTRAGRKQLYGSQLRRAINADGKTELIPATIEDSSHADLRRDAAGLPPLAYSLCKAGTTK